MFQRLIASTMALAAVSAVTALSPFASASWPQTPEHPLVLGFGSLPQSARAVVADTGDQATWALWMDDQCFGSIRLQRIDADGNLLAPGGLVVETLSGCQNPDMRATARPDGSVVFGWSENVLQTGMHRPCSTSAS